MARALGIAAALALLLAALASARAAAGEPIIVTRDSGSLPSGCTPRETAELLVRLADAVGAGDMKALDRLFAIEDPPGQAPEPAGLAFRWFSVTEGRAGDGPWRHSVFYDRVDLFPYFAARRKANERWELVSVNIGIASSSRPGAVGIGYTIRRSADDLPSSLTEYAQGKGEIDCPAQRIFVWSMGQDERDRVPAGEVVASCPVPAEWTPGSAIIACSRSSESAERAGPNARALTPDFKVIAGSTRLPSQCDAQRASKRLRLALAAFNAGRGASFSGHLAPRGRFHPYPPTERPLIGRTAIAAFVAARYAEGDGWTGTTLRAPRRSEIDLFAGARRRVAAYRLNLLLSSPGLALAASSARVVFDCRSGLIHRWTGPSVPMP